MYRRLEEKPVLGWDPVFVEKKRILKKVSEVLEQKGKNPYFPCNDELFTAFEKCPLVNVKVIIMGQDPYDREQDAVGMAFSGRQGCTIPPSLNIIYKELERCYSDFETPEDGWLGHWAEQGVLLLNSFLTSHKKKLDSTQRQFWNPFLEAVIETVVRQNPDVIIVLWGIPAQKLMAKYLDLDKYNVLRGYHPSPRNCGSKTEFIGCGHFRQINRLLRKQGKDQIRW